MVARMGSSSLVGAFLDNALKHHRACRHHGDQQQIDHHLRGKAERITTCSRPPPCGGAPRSIGVLMSMMFAEASA